MLLSSQEDQLAALLARFLQGGLTRDELSGEALELLGLSEEESDG